MRKRVMLLMGLMPFTVGYIEMASANWVRFPAQAQMWFSVLLLVGWGAIAYALFAEGDSAFQNAARMNAPAVIVLALLLFQEIVRGAYWPNLAGILTQAFYLPTLPVGFLLTQGFSRVWPAYSAGFALMALASVIGGTARARRLAMRE